MEPLHYYSLAFMAPNGGAIRCMNTIVEVELNYINSKTIQKIKEDNNLPSNATLLSTSYLGFMTKKQWKGE